MFALHEDEDTPENRRARIEAHLRAKYPERFPQTEEVGLGASTRLESADPTVPQSAPASAKPESDGIRALLERYKAAGDTSELEDAQGKQKVAKAAGLFGDAFSSLATAAGRARGYQSDSSGYWDRVGKFQDDDVASAKQRIKDRQAGILQEDQFEQTGIARDRAGKDWNRKQTLAGREDAEYGTKQQAEKDRSDPASPLSRTMQDLVKRLDPEKDWSGASAAQIGAVLPGLEKLAAQKMETDKTSAYERGREADREERRLDRAAGLQRAGMELTASERREAERRREALGKEERDRAFDREKLTAPKALGAEEKKRYDNARMATTAVEDMSKAVDAGDNTFSLVGDNNFTESRRRFQESLGRLQSGGAIGKDEEARFAAMAPTMGDSKEMKQRKLQKIRDELAGITGSLGQPPASESPSGGAKVFSRGAIPEAD